MTASSAPTATVSSSPTTILVSTPEAGDGISVSTLSVETSSSGSSALTWSPSCLSHRVTVPSLTLSPSAGMRHRGAATTAVASSAVATRLLGGLLGRLLLLRRGFLLLRLGRCCSCGAASCCWSCAGGLPGLLLLGWRLLGLASCCWPPSDRRRRRPRR